PHRSTGLVWSWLMRSKRHKLLILVHFNNLFRSVVLCVFFVINMSRTRKYSLIHTFLAIKGLRLFLDSDGCIAGFAVIMLYSISHYFRRVAGMMYLDSTRTVLKVSHLSFWGHRRDIYSTDVMTLGESGDTKGELILGLKRYSRSDTLYFSSRLGRMVDKNAFEKVFGSLS
uniref:Transmembrane protein 186 n=1 Tax=Cyprinus carpio TaxID=7962 RepID=A0A8C1PIT5_CYPCA